MRYAGAPPKKYCVEFCVRYLRYLQVSFRICDSRQWQFNPDVCRRSTERPLFPTAVTQSAESLDDRMAADGHKRSLRISSSVDLTK